MDAAPIVVRPARASDVADLVAFNAQMAQETEGRELDPERLTRGVQAVLEDGGRGRYLVADSADRVLGSLLLTFEWSDWRNAWFWWIQSVFVRESERGRGVFRALYDHVREAAQAAPDVCGLRLYVERENQRAQRTYENVGMSRTRYRMFEVDFVLEP